MKPSLRRVTNLLALLALFVSTAGMGMDASCAAGGVPPRAHIAPVAPHAGHPFQRVERPAAHEHGSSEQGQVPACPIQAALSACAAGPSLPPARFTPWTHAVHLDGRWSAQSERLPSLLLGAGVFRPPRTVR
jgi:hypothetical protein